MKKRNPLLLVICIFIYACSNDLNDSSTSDSSLITANYEPYISPQMQEILNMIDTATTAIPIEKLIPFVEDSNSSSAVVLRSSSADGTTVAKGFSKYATLYTKVKTVISATQASNFNTKAGTYYITCVSATLYQNTSGELLDAMLETDVMGINPDDLTQRGYHIDEKKAGSLYYLTTYTWGLATGATEDYIESEWIPRIYTGTGYSFYSDYYTYISNLQWRYYEL